ncbi:macrophage mannose receptor 1-like [Syngnathus typhle]|uniref:macrophage mannose receptor 1-like n=1 Tax=Syngnathus typhle TaxID=161592 RepID=UPI002A6B39B1|nr:macrophage mannose receptor 1-like [Syngnathus typhle]
MANECAPGWFEHGSSCYKKEVVKPNGWLGARHHCVWQGGDLLSITSSAEEDFVKRTMGNTRFWLGLSNQKCDNILCDFEGGTQKLTWSDGETMTYTNWASDQLKSWLGEKKKCNNYEWTDGTASDYGKTAYGSSGDCSRLDGNKDLDRNFGCQNTYPPVCKTAKRGGPPQLPPLVGQPDWTEKCGWWMDYPKSDFCYLMIRQSTETWQEAQANCQHLHGNLLSITEDHEQTFVHGYFTGLTNASSLWLGANVAISDEGSTWADGASFTYGHSTSGLSETVVCCHLEERRSTEIFSPAPQVPPRIIVSPSSLATATGTTTRATRREVTSARREEM